MTPPSATPWIAYRRPNAQARLRLFCFPYAGGGANIYRGWSGRLPPEVEVCPVQLPGRETRLREPPLRRMPPLITALAQALEPYLDLPFCFFGHSMGAVVSIELARHLRRAQRPQPLQLFVSGRRAPQLPDPDPPKYSLPHEEFIAEIKRLGGTPDEALQAEELMQLLIPVLRADCEVIDEYVYQPEPPLSCPISCYGGLQDDEAPREQLEAWAEQTTARFELALFPGGHFFLNEAQGALLQCLSRELQARLAGLQPGQALHP